MLEFVISLKNVSYGQWRLVRLKLGGAALELFFFF